MDTVARRGYLGLWILIPVLCLFVVGALYCLLEYVNNKGPDDVGAILHASRVIKEKSPGASLDVLDYTFTKDIRHPGSGSYKFPYALDGKNGSLVCHYNGTSGKFDGDVAAFGK